jgi:hypothetical protein
MNGSTCKNKYESVWVKIKDANCTEAEIEKCNIYFRQSFDICFIIAELDFTTTNEMQGDIVFNIPELNKDFIYCENTILANKIDEDGDEIKTMIHVKLYPSKLVLEGYPMSSNTKYTLNFQFFTRTM